MSLSLLRCAFFWRIFLSFSATFPNHLSQRLFTLLFLHVHTRTLVAKPQHTEQSRSSYSSGKQISLRATNPLGKIHLKPTLKLLSESIFGAEPPSGRLWFRPKPLSTSPLCLSVSSYTCCTAAFSSFYFYFIFVSQISSHPKNFIFLLYLFSWFFVAHSRRRRRRQSRLDRHNSKRRPKRHDQDHFDARFCLAHCGDLSCWISKHFPTLAWVHDITKSRRNCSATKTADSYYCDGDDDATRSFEYPPKTEYVNGKIDNFDFSSCPSWFTITLTHTHNEKEEIHQHTFAP